MYGLDLNTFLIVFEATVIVYAITALFVYLIRRHLMHVYISLAFSASFFGFEIVRQSLGALTQLQILQFNFFLLLSFALLIGSLRTYFDIPLWTPIIVAVLILGFVLLIGFTYFVPAYLGRVFAVAIVQILLISSVLFDSRIKLKQERRGIAISYQALLIFIALFSLARFLGALLVGPTADVATGLKMSVLIGGFSYLIINTLWLTASMLLEANQTATDLKQEKEAMESLAMMDPLTHLYNRNKMDQDLSGFIEHGNRSGDSASILLIDLDHFKEINDTRGHDVGDQVLIQSANVILGLLRSDDVVYRWGGDEFLILAPNTDLNGAARLAQRLIDKFTETPFPTIETMGLSIGCAQHFRYETKTDWFKRVDLALYKAKQAGRNRFEVWANDELLPETIAKLVWSPMFESGHSEIDRQHQDLLILSNELYDLLGSADSMSSMEGVLDRVESELQAHFTYESDVMAQTGFNLTSEHIKIHDDLLNEYAAMRAELKAGSVNLSAFFNFVSVRIVAEHIIKEDAKFFTYFKSRQS